MHNKQLFVIIFRLKDQPSLKMTLFRTEFLSLSPPCASYASFLLLSGELCS